MVLMMSWTREDYKIQRKDYKALTTSKSVKLLSRAQLFVTPWSVAHHAPPSMGFSRQEYWSGLPFLSPGDLADPGIEPASPAVAGGVFTTEPSEQPFPKNGTPSFQLDTCPLSLL